MRRHGRRGVTSEPGMTGSPCEHAAERLTRGDEQAAFGADIAVAVLGGETRRSERHMLRQSRVGVPAEAGSACLHEGKHR